MRSDQQILPTKTVPEEPRDSAGLLGSDRAGAKPVAAYAAWQTDAQDAVQVVLAATRRARTPEPLRRARTLARTRRAHTR
jgi:hypothetical protein